jgi:hypothetical protein
MTYRCKKCNGIANNGKEIKEGFCVACLAPIAALAAAGTAAGAAATPQEKEKQRKISLGIMWGSVGLTVLSILIFIYFMWIRKKCSSCVAPSPPKSSFRFFERRRRGCGCG